MLRLLALAAVLFLAHAKGADETPPSVAFEKFRDGDFVGGTVTINAAATDDDAVQKVTFSKGETVVFTDSEAPFAASVDFNSDIPGRTHTITAEAVDPSGNTSTTTIQVTKPSHTFGPPGSTPTRNGVFFKVWAPHASEVVLKGDFTDTTTTNYMWKTDGWFFTFQPGAKPGQKYRYVINDSLERPDPYGRAMEHSAGASIIKDPSTFQWTDAPWKTPKFENMIIYELHVGTFVGKNDGQTYPGNLKNLLTKLDYIKSTGANMIELLPLHEVPGPIGPDPTPYLGYSPVGLFAVESAYGKNPGDAYDDLKTLVNTAHDKGLGVILDVVYNHFSTQTGDDNWYWEYDGHAEGGDGGIYFRNEQTDWGIAPDWTRNEVRQYIEENAKYWLSEFHLDGLRWDATTRIKDKTGGWEAMRDIVWNLRQAFPEKIQICENLPYERALVESGNFHTGWWVDFHKKLKEALLNPAGANLQEVKNGINGGDYSHPTKRVIYAISHDEARNGSAYLVQDFGGRDNWDARAKARLMGALNFLCPGIPMIWQGEEFAHDSWFEDKESHAINWSFEHDSIGSQMLRLYRDASRVRWSHSVLRQGNLTWTHEDSNNKVLAFRRDHDNQSILVVVNLGEISFGNHSYGVRTGKDGQWTQILCSQDSAYGGWDGAGNAFHEPWTENGEIKLNVPKFSVVAMRRK